MHFFFTFEPLPVRHYLQVVVFSVVSRALGEEETNDVATYEEFPHSTPQIRTLDPEDHKNKTWTV